jgi:hypothetical protein
MYMQTDIYLCIQNGHVPDTTVRRWNSVLFFPSPVFAPHTSLQSLNISCDGKETERKTLRKNSQHREEEDAAENYERG